MCVCRLKDRTAQYKGRLFSLKSQALLEHLITAIMLFQWGLTTSMEFLAAVLFWSEGEEPGNGKPEHVTTHFIFFFASIIYPGSEESVGGWGQQERSRWSGEVWHSHL